MVIKDGKKMSKSIGNVVSPEEIIGRYGADTARLFILFAAPPDRELDWSDAGVEGSYRFLNRVYRLIFELAEKCKDAPKNYEISGKDDKSLAYEMNASVKKVTEDAGGRFMFNTAISSIMELVNEMYRYKEISNVNTGLLADAAEKLVLILSPFAPHICEEMWQHLGHEKSIYDEAWPSYDESKIVKDEVEIVVQINGKIKEKLNVQANLYKATFEKTVMEDDRVKALLDGVSVIKVIAVPDKLLNVVVK